jgi:hypothetical protein
MRCCGHNLGTATGFFWDFGKKTFLVTNWHVVAGRKPDTMIPLHKDAAVPDEIVYPRFIKGESYHKVVQSKVSLNYADDKPVWLQHPVHGSSVDVAAIDVPTIESIETIKGALESIVFTAGSVSRRLFEASKPWYGPRHDMGDDLFILGFPLGLKPTGHLPMRKRASVATEMDVLIEGKPSFLVDSATREGMSGSPVIHIDRTGTRYWDGISAPGRKISFVGVYSGRHIGDTEIAAMLGVVWREEIIREIIVGKRPGFIDLSKLP